MKKIFLIPFLIFCNIVYADCYIVVNEVGNSRENLSFATSVFNRYLEKVEQIPIEGIKQKDCIYDIHVVQNDAEVTVIVSGKVNAFSESNNFKSALLKALLSLNREKICQDFGYLLLGECQLDVNVMFLNENGNLSYFLKNKDQFNIIIQPLSTVYVYIMNVDNLGLIDYFFPDMNPLLKDQIYVIPSLKSKTILAINEIKNETLYVVYSKNRIIDLDAVSKDLNHLWKRGIFVKKVF